MKICIVGLGYVGLPLAIQFARSGADVIGLDVDRAKVDQVNRGRSYIKHIAAKTISEVLKAKRLTASRDFSRIKKADAVIICVPTSRLAELYPNCYQLDRRRLVFYCRGEF